MKSKYIITLIIAAVIATGFSGCSLLRKRVEKTEKVEYKLSAENKSKLVIDNSNGDIKITRTDDTLRYILVEAIKTADVKQDEIDKPIDNITINVDTTGSLVKIETDIRHGGGMFRKNRSGKVKFNIKVPAGLDVKIDNINGDITLVRISNNIDIETINSSMNLNHCSGNISINGVNGGVHANFDSTKGINIDLVNGIVKLGGMKNISADVDAATTNGKIKFNNLHFDNLIAEKKNLSGTLGKGGSFIKVNTVNGNITFDAGDIAYKKDIDIGIKFDFGDDEHIKVEEKNIDDDEYDTEKDDDKKTPDKKGDTNKIPDAPKKGDTLKNNK
jgi:hypothetical protein